jgi:transcriptional regulator with XRE-family HTH domain
MAKQLTAYEKQVARIVGANVRDVREARGVSRAQVGAWLNQSDDAVAKAERGERRFSVADVVRLALEFDCAVDQLIFGARPRPRLLRKSTVTFDD